MAVAKSTSTSTVPGELIYERLQRQQRPGVLVRRVPPKQWSRRRKPGRHKIR